MNCEFIQKPIKLHFLRMIKFGSKTYEGRLHTKIEEWGLKKGSKIKFYDEENDNSWIFVEVTELLEFPDFANAFDWLGAKLIPGKSKVEVVKLYNELFHYPTEVVIEGKTSQMILDKGVVAIGFKILEIRNL